jgi:cytoskeletal protein RodZ
MRAKVDIKKESFGKVSSKKKMHIGRIIALVCFVFLIIGGILLVLFGYRYSRRVKDFINKWRHHSLDVQDIKNTVQESVTNGVEDSAHEAVNKTVESLKPGTALSQTGVGNKNISDVKITGKAVLVTGVLVAPPNTSAKVELLESGSGQLIATLSFGTSAGQSTATTAKLFTVIPGTYKVNITTVGAWNVTIVEK